LAGKIMLALLDVSSVMELHRLPELFCGLERRIGEGPTLYPVACSPQAWAAAAPFLLIQSCLGCESKALVTEWCSSVHVCLRAFLSFPSEDCQWELLQLICSSSGRQKTCASKSLKNGAKS